MVSRTAIEISLDKLHLSILPKATREAFLFCIGDSFFENQGWYLAGGTALSLQVGHRKSVDLDFFTHEKMFEEKKVEEYFASKSDWQTTSLSKGTVYGELCGSKISLISYPFFTPNDPYIKINSVMMVSPADIAVMKIVAISQRGRKRDFYDLYWLSLNGVPLRQSLEKTSRQYSVKQNFNHILKSLVYFEDAEDDPQPEIYFNATWEDIKNFFKKEVPLIAL